MLSRDRSLLSARAVVQNGGVNTMKHNVAITGLLVLLIAIGCIGVCQAANLVYNGNFEIGTLSDLYYGSGGQTSAGPGWTIAFPTTWSYAGSENTHHPANRNVYEGNESAFVETEANGWVQYYQDISVASAAEYTASVYVIGVELAAGAGFGAADTDWAGVRCVEYDNVGNVVAENMAGITEATTEYVQQSVTFTTTANTMRIRFILEGKIMCQWPNGRIMFDVAALEGPYPPARPCRFFQVIPAVGGSSYNAKAQFMAVTGNPEAQVWGTAGDDQMASLYVQEYGASGTAIGATKTAVAAETGAWEALSIPAFAANANTKFIEVGGTANLLQVISSGDRAVFDNFELNGAPGAPAMSIKDVKGLADGSAANVAGQVCTAAFADYFYIESSDRVAGIRVLGKAVRGQLITAAGVVNTIDGEKTLVPNLLGAASGGTIPRPLGLNNRSVAAPPGLSGVGLYVVAWGRVDAAGGNVFTLTDGAGNAIKVYGPAGFSAAANSYVRVAAALGSETADTTVVPVLRAISVTKQD